MDTTEQKQKEEGTTQSVTTKSASPSERRRGNQDSSGRPRRGRGGGPQSRSDVDKRVISVRRVSRVVAGGRRFSLSVAVVVGDGRGKVGVGVGKGADMSIAIDKATHQARRRMVHVAATSDGGVPHPTQAKYCASVVLVRPGRGFVAGGAVRSVVELAGLRNVNAKILSRSKNHINNARAALRALASYSV